jgi:hypothetical protein
MVRPRMTNQDVGDLQRNRVHWNVRRFYRPQRFYSRASSSEESVGYWRGSNRGGKTVLRGPAKVTRRYGFGPFLFRS